ncbi:peptide ABC transporter ATP-binding protein [Verrucomicrobia bacterium LW23]|nr:peptide ABC transporter ATP-binding protein [Verrucomicrobia bacterium LW23]
MPTATLPASTSTVQAPSGAVSPCALRIENLKTHFMTDDGAIPAVDGVSLSLSRGKVLAIVGESGCGKSVTSYSILRLIRPPGQIVDGSIMYYPGDGTRPIDIAKLNEKSDDLYRVRGGYISMIFQEPMTALSPVHTVGNQISEAILLHQKLTPAQAREKAIEMLRKVGIPGAERRIDQYPHEMSGGMRQRVVIAMALVCDPDILIADEPTTALDVTIQAQILKLIKDLQASRGTSVVFITHDLGVVAQIAHDVAVMYLGRVVENGSVRQVLKSALHPYTQALLKSIPSLGTRGARLPAIRGSVPSLTNIPPGCPFHPRCEHAVRGRCDVGGPPALRTFTGNRKAACVRIEEIHPTVRELTAAEVAAADTLAAEVTAAPAGRHNH